MHSSRCTHFRGLCRGLLEISPSIDDHVVLIIHHAIMDIMIGLVRGILAYYITYAADIIAIVYDISNAIIADDHPDLIAIITIIIEDSLIDLIAIITIIIADAHTGLIAIITAYAHTDLITNIRGLVSHAIVANARAVKRLA